MLKDLYNRKLNIAISIMVIINVKICKAGVRIFGGRDAVRGEFPFAVRLEEQITKFHGSKKYFGYHRFCSGAAITPTWILTAAHCDNVSHKGNYNIMFQPEINLFARYNSYFPNDLGQLSPIIKIVRNPAYYMFDDTYRAKYDIALVQTENIKVSHYGKISGVDYMSFVGHEALVLGFGGTNATAKHKPLQVLKGILLKCKETERNAITMLCLVPPCGLDATICRGDSGGPVLHASGIVGVNSMSFGDCNKFSHTLYPGASAGIVSMVSPVIDWISNIISNKTVHRL